MANEAQKLYCIYPTRGDFFSARNNVTKKKIQFQKRRFVNRKSSLKPHLSSSGSKLVIEGENLDSVFKLVIQYTSKNPSVSSLQRVSWSFFCVFANFALVTVSLMKGCNGSANATHTECWAPAFPHGVADTGELFIHVDGKNNLWRHRFDYQPPVKVIPFENEDNLLLLKPGEDEVSLHVCFTVTHVAARSLGPALNAACFSVPVTA